ncbi:MAG TPA: helix-turn-helix domain-containing protein [Mycobacteriales bacterium]|jgi:AcrR family transcriptional regulator|nr:helix-turn-helix domain-containing protein [Mycobacteriales bacterium]
MPKVSPERMAATRRRVLDGARRAFAANGYEGATVRRLEEETGLSRGAIFHHFADKDALFLALAEEDAEEVATLVDDFGLVGAMHKLRDKEAGWLGVQLEVSRRVRTDPAFANLWSHHLRAITRATQARLARQRDAGVVRDDVPVETLAAFLLLVYDGLVAQLATGMPVQHLEAILDLAEQSVRETPPNEAPSPSARRPQ